LRILSPTARLYELPAHRILRATSRVFRGARAWLHPSFHRKRRRLSSTVQFPPSTAFVRHPTGAALPALHPTTALQAVRARPSPCAMDCWIFPSPRPRWPALPQSELSNCYAPPRTSAALRSDPAPIARALESLRRAGTEARRANRRLFRRARDPFPVP